MLFLSELSPWCRRGYLDGWPSNSYSLPFYSRVVDHSLPNVGCPHQHPGDI
uniref:Uncharacterized protein n=1 Tax=uncultured alpha proteobacterium EF100_102A06 TaxID=710799 RepID=E0Y264_9PROT|nr:hypothetical protein [uncultured alpha proteobacterium EF100_102A06]